MSIKKTKAQQQGGALLVAMVLIFMLSIMGVSSMRGSSLERRMATNSVQNAATFQAAESLTDVVLNDPDNLETAWTMQPGKFRVPDIDLKNHHVAAQAVDAQFIGNSIPLGFSVGVNTGGNFAAFNYVVQGGSVMTENRTASAVTQGAYRIVPGL